MPTTDATPPTTTDTSVATEHPARSSRALRPLRTVLTGLALPALGWLALVASLGALVLARVARRADRPRRTFLVVAGVVLAVSLAGPAGAVSPAAAGGLLLLHLLTAAGVVPTVTSRLAARR